MCAVTMRDFPNYTLLDYCKCRKLWCRKFQIVFANMANFETAQRNCQSARLPERGAKIYWTKILVKFFSLLKVWNTITPLRGPFHFRKSSWEASHSVELSWVVSLSIEVMCSRQKSWERLSAELVSCNSGIPKHFRTWSLLLFGSILYSWKVMMEPLAE